MGHWPSVKAKHLRKSLERIGWTLKRSGGTSHDVYCREGYADYVFAFHEGEEIGPKMLARVAKRTGLQREDL